jgi:hypothetical protein
VRNLSVAPGMSVGMRGAPMFTVKWVVRGQAEQLESEGFTIIQVENLIVACRYRMANMPVCWCAGITMEPF